MSIVRPFRAVKYNVEQVLLKNVIAPPYDVISPVQRQEYIKRSPYNVVAIDLPTENESGDNKYNVAGKLYRKWKDDKVLIKDNDKSFYLYEQIYDYAGKQYTRTGFVGLLKLAEFGQGQVFPHEKTLAGPKVDRYELMKESKANFSQIFGLYQDDENKLNPIFNEVRKKPAIYTATDSERVKHSVWQISDLDMISKIENLMRDKPVYIADGHHRYETALKYRDDMRQAEGALANEEHNYDYVMMMFVNFNDAGLKVFPTHRVVDVASEFKDDEFIAYAAEKFELTELKSKEDVEAFLKANAEDPGSWVFKGIDKILGLKLSDRANLHPVYSQVSTYLLEDFVLKGFFKYSDDRLLAKAGIHFLQSWEEISDYQSSQPSVAFMLNSESMQSIRNVSENGLVMPQKSTFFYPKLATGLLFNDL